MKKFFIILAAFTFYAGFAQAQVMPKAEVEKRAKFAHENMEGLQIRPGEFITKEEAAKLKYPLVPYEIIEMTLVQGSIAGNIESCGLDWQKYTKKHRDYLKGKYPDWNVYQFSYVGLLYGIAKSEVIQARGGAPCSDDLKRKLKILMG